MSYYVSRAKLSYDYLEHIAGTTTNIFSDDLMTRYTENNK